MISYSFGMNSLTNSIIIGLLSAFAAHGAVYEVGPEKKMAALSEVPWSSLRPGDTVLIHWRSDPYKEKWIITSQGAPGAPIDVGV